MPGVHDRPDAPGAGRLVGTAGWHRHRLAPADLDARSRAVSMDAAGAGDLASAWVGLVCFALAPVLVVSSHGLGTRAHGYYRYLDRTIDRRCSLPAQGALRAAQLRRRVAGRREFHRRSRGLARSVFTGEARRRADPMVRRALVHIVLVSLSPVVFRCVLV